MSTEERPWTDEEKMIELYVDEDLSQPQIADKFDCSVTTISRWMNEDHHDIDTSPGGDLEYEDIAMFSGGNDSLVMTHYVMENDICDCVLHLDTNTGVPENQEYVEEVCEKYDWPLEIRSANKTLKEFALDYGFPKAGSHGWAYRYFKEHTLARFTTELASSDPHYYTGVRKAESDRRMRNITDEYQERERWTWVAPIMDWTMEDVLEYRDEHDLPKNPVAEEIHRSGECYCGAYANRNEELIDLQAKYPEHAEWLLNLEQEVQEEIGTNEDYCYWGSSGMSSEELQDLMDGEEDPAMVLCQDCELNRKPEGAD